MSDNDDLYEVEDLDALTRAELAEHPGPGHAVATALDEWIHRLHGLTPSNHGAGLFLDLLAEQGWEVVKNGVPPLAVLFPVPGAVPVPREALDQLVEVARYASLGRSAVDHQPDGAPYPDSIARVALGALGEAGLLDLPRLPAVPERVDVRYTSGATDEEIQRATAAVRESVAELLNEIGEGCDV